MPELIKHIDAIAREKQRGVLYVAFRSPPSKHVDLDEIGDDGDEIEDVNSGIDWETLPIRQEIINWLDEHGIAWEKCGHYAQTNLMMGYRGQLYIDLPYDRSLPAYQMLEAFLENPDGSMRFAKMMFIYLSLEMAMKNAAHDEPGFWEKWAENF